MTNKNNETSSFPKGTTEFVRFPSTNVFGTLQTLDNIDIYIDLCDVNINILDKYLNKYDKLMQLNNTYTNFKNIFGGSNENNRSIIKDRFNSKKYAKIGDECLINLYNMSSLINNINKSKNSKIKSDINKQYKKTKKSITSIMEQFNYEKNKFESANNMKEHFENNNKIIEHFPGLNGLLKPLRDLVNGFKNILNTVKNIGKNIGDIFTKIFKKIFGVMLDVFKFIANEVIPLLKKIIKFILTIIKNIPKFTKFIWDNIMKIINGIKKKPLTPVIFILIYFVLFFCSLMYLKLVTGLDETIPKIIVVVGTLPAVILLLLFSKYDILGYINDRFYDIFIYLFKIRPINNYVNKILNNKDYVFGINRKKDELNVLNFLFSNIYYIAIATIFILPLIRYIFVMICRIIQSKIDKVVGLTY